MNELPLKKLTVGPLDTDRIESMFKGAVIIAELEYGDPAKTIIGLWANQMGVISDFKGIGAGETAGSIRSTILDPAQRELRGIGFYKGREIWDQMSHQQRLQLQEILVFATNDFWTDQAKDLERGSVGKAPTMKPGAA